MKPFKKTVAITFLCQLKSGSIKSMFRFNSAHVSKHGQRVNPMINVADVGGVVDPLLVSSTPD